jgi:C-terminal processing protease CtpA/Prc
MSDHPNTAVLTESDRHEILNRILSALNKKFYDPAKLGANWKEAVAKLRPQIEQAESTQVFEKKVTELLGELKRSHLGFFPSTAARASSRAALSATYLQDDTPYGLRWIFQDVHADGAADLAGIQPGHILLRVNGEEIQPPDHPAFNMGQTSELELSDVDGKTRSARVAVAKPKRKKLHFAEPKLVESRMIGASAAYMKVAMFPGMVGVEVANQISRAIELLGPVQKLVVDLRGNTGGGAACLRVMSLLTPDRIPVGFAAERKWTEEALENEKESFPRFHHIPANTRFLWLLAIQYAPVAIMKKPVVLETEGLGRRSFHGKVVLLVNRHTASAAEMIVAFAKEHRLATIVGEKTAGRLLSATSVKVGHGYRLALPTGNYRTWTGWVLEGKPIEPDIEIPFDWKERSRGLDRQLQEAEKVAQRL